MLPMAANLRESCWQWDGWSHSAIGSPFGGFQGAATFGSGTLKFSLRRGKRLQNLLPRITLNFHATAEISRSSGNRKVERASRRNTRFLPASATKSSGQLFSVYCWRLGTKNWCLDWMCSWTESSLAVIKIKVSEGSKTPVYRNHTGEKHSVSSITLAMEVLPSKPSIWVHADWLFNNQRQKNASHQFWLRHWLPIPRFSRLGCTTSSSNPASCIPAGQIFVRQ